MGRKKKQEFKENVNSENIEKVEVKINEVVNPSDAIKDEEVVETIMLQTKDVINNE